MEEIQDLGTVIIKEEKENFTVILNKEFDDNEFRLQIPIHTDEKVGEPEQVYLQEREVCSYKVENYTQRLK
jgi:hypothetical protein